MSNNKTSKFWGCDMQHSDYSQQYCIILVSIAKRGLKCPHHRKEMLLMQCDGDVSQHYGGNDFTIQRLSNQ